MRKRAHHLLPRLGAFLLLGFFATPSFSAPGDFLTPEIPVNEAEASFPDDLNIASDADGNLLAVWVDSRQILGRRLAADGTPLGDTLTLVDDANKLGPQGLAMAPDGSFVIAFRRNLPAAHYGAFVQRFDALGNPVGRERTLNVPHPAQNNPSLAIVLSLGGALQRREMAPAVGMDADGNFNIVWEQEAEISSNTRMGVLVNYVRTRIYLQRFNANGRRTGLVRTLARGSTPLLITSLPIGRGSGLVGNPRIAVQPDGDFAVAWQRSRRSPDPSDAPRIRVTDIELRGFSAFGFGTGPARNLVDEAADQADLQGLTALNGDYLAAWDQGELANVQRVDERGEAAGTLYSVTGSGSALAAAPDGSAAWTWVEDAGAEDDDLKTQLIDPSGAIAGNPFQVPEPSAARQFAPRASSDPAGNFTIGWTRAPVGSLADHHFRVRRVEGLQ